jgi:hypothetical protein
MSDLDEGLETANERTRRTVSALFDIEQTHLPEFV